jgi:hypothetical protein
MGGEYSAADPVAKLLGKTRQGELVLGYVRAPGHPGLTAILSPQPPRLTGPGTLAVTVENFGLKKSAPTTLKVTLRGDGREPVTVAAPVPALEPYASTEVTLTIDPKLVSGKQLQVETAVGHPDAASSITSKL